MKIMHWPTESSNTKLRFVLNFEHVIKYKFMIMHKSFIQERFMDADLMKK